MGGLYIPKASADLTILGQMGMSLSLANPNAYAYGMGKFFKAYAEFFKESPIGMKFNIVFLTLITPVLIFACIEAFVEFLNKEPQPQKPMPLSYSELFKNCIESIEGYDDPRFDSAVESCMEIGKYRE